MGLLSIEEAAIALNVSKSTVYTAGKEGKIEAYKIAGRIKISQDSIQNYLKSCLIVPTKLNDGE